MNTRSISHIPEDLLERYALGQLARPDCAPLHRHMLLCPSCQVHLKQTCEYIKVMKAAAARLFLTRSELTDPHHWKIHPAWAAGFAALLILAIPLYRGNVTAVALTAERGAFSMPHARAGYVFLRVDVTEIRQEQGYQLEVVNANGRPIWHASVEATRNEVAAEIPKRLGSGRYWIRLYDSGAPWTLLREYGLEVE